MPATRTGAKSKGGTRQLTLTGEFANVAPSSSSSKSKSKSSVERTHTDVILSLYSKWVGPIERREKNHEYRTYELRSTVTKIWLYITAPTSAITHVMVTGPAKTPGEVKMEGTGNDEFDAGMKVSKFGYEILSLYRLKTPLDLEAMKTYGVSTPMGYMYAPKKLVDELPLESMDKVF